MKVSLVLATVGRTNDLSRCLQSIELQSAPCLELIIVDQNSDDRLVPIMHDHLARGLNIVHLRMAHPNLSAARNLGIQHARGDIVGFPDDDCWYEQECIAEVIEGLSKEVAWGAVLASWVEQDQALVAAETSTVLSSTAWRRYRGGQASSICLFVRLAVFRDHGGFDERLGVGQWYGAGEETDWVLRTLKAGVVIGRRPSARVHHRFTTEIARLSRNQLRITMTRSRGTGALYVKHRLSCWVILRGLFAPPVKALLCRDGNVALACAQSWGRLQGAIGWLFHR